MAVEVAAGMAVAGVAVVAGAGVVAAGAGVVAAGAGVGDGPSGLLFEPVLGLIQRLRLLLLRLIAGKPIGVNLPHPLAPRLADGINTRACLRPTAARRSRYLWNSDATRCVSG
jgi:hypothetical protein